MSIDTPGTVIIAGWYPDPTDSTQARWWDGSQWTLNRRPRDHQASAHAPAAVHEPAPVPAPVHAAGEDAIPDPASAPVAAPTHQTRYFSPVPIRTDATLPPIDPYRPLNRRHDSQGFVSMGVKQTVKFRPTRAYTGSVWAIATSPVWSTLISLVLMIGLDQFFTQFLMALTAVLYLVVIVAFAIHDQKVLLNSLHPVAASPWWMLLSPLIYLIARGVHVSRTVGHGWAPMIVFLICSLVPAGAALAFSYLLVFFSTLIGA